LMLRNDNDGNQSHAADFANCRKAVEFRHPDGGSAAR
jgi:hypothetical protein